MWIGVAVMQSLSKWCGGEVEVVILSEAKDLKLEE